MNAQIKPMQQWFGSNSTALQGAAAPMLVVAILAMMVLPLPPLLLDTFFTINIAVALMVMMVAAYMIRPLDFAAFPSVLLLTTLMRLSLNVASTRVVLMEGQASLQTETYDLRVFMVPEINAGTASLVATAINPAIGLGTLALVGLAAFVGHLYPVFFRFIGGKGVATAGGCFLVLSAASCLAAIGVFALVLGVLLLLGYTPKQLDYKTGGPPSGWCWSPPMSHCWGVLLMSVLAKSSVSTPYRRRTSCGLKASDTA